jgi:hypothetical protein
MRIVVLLGFVALVLVGIGVDTRPAGAVVIYPWCAFMGRNGQNCGFTTYEQCRATILGIGGYCGTNPFWPGIAPARGAKPIWR